MDMQKNPVLTGPGNRLNVAGDLLWFAAASVGAGLMSAVAAGALVILLA